MTTPGEKLRQFRSARKMSQYDLSRRAGIEQATISRIEREKMQLVSPNAQPLADALGIKVGELLDLQSNVVAASPGYRRIPVLDYIQAGNFAGVAPYFRDEEMTPFILTDLQHSSETFAMKIRGNSMEPTFSEGDLIVIDTALAAQPGDFVVAADAAGEATFKQYRAMGINDAGQSVFELIPLNPAYAPMRSDRQEITIKGVMVEYRKYRKR